MKKQLLYILGILMTLQVGVSSQMKAATRTWLGSVNSSYFTSGNWNSGVPDSTDNIIINSNAPYNLTLTQNHKVASFTINGDTLDLGGYTLTITGTCTFNGGKTTTGIIKPTGTLCHFGGGIIDSRIEANCGYYHMNGSSFLKTTILVSTGSASSSGTGNCTFSDSLTITHSGVYYFTMGSTNGDNFQNVTITNNSTHEFYLGTADSTFISGNLILNNTSSGGIVTGNTGGVTYLASGKTISIGSSGFPIIT
ncbi:MAG: hypothetical protein IPP71_03295 [Bacteroidetes bacterium]|nr:hypothetical protein [Bacteroidota bacterium]